jgi:protein-S-isoprenylcysteine O-methyltransferase Ste14
MASEPGSRLLVPPVYFLVALLLMAFFHQVAPAAQLIVAPYRYAGIVLMALAIALILWAALLFRRAGTNIRPFLPSTALVISGPYRFTRNPMYLGFALLTLGLVLLIDSAWMLLAVPIGLGLIQSLVIVREERYLERKFGEEYLTYKARVRRWI